MAISILGLADLSAEVWASIVEDYIATRDLVALFLAGQRSLWQKLMLPGVVRSITLSTDFPAGPAPFRSLLSLPHLKHLGLILSNTSTRTQELLEHTSPKLESLTILWSPEHYGRRWPGWSPSVLPRSLLEFRSNLPIYDKDFGSLPRTLTMLELSRQSSVDGDGFGDLPPLLRHLRLCMTSEHLGKLSESLSHLPGSITALELPYLSHLDTKFVKALPPTLLQLNLSRVHALSDAQLALLPRGLTHLNIKAASTVTNGSLTNLPPNLTFLCLQPNNDTPASPTSSPTNGTTTLTADAARLLPPTLTSYGELPRTLQREYTRMYLQNQLQGTEDSPKTSLPRWASSNLTDELVTLLPAHLLSLDLTDNRFITEHGILKVPLALERLFLPKTFTLPGMLFKRLPRTLLDLDIANTEGLEDSHLLALPHKLTRLRLCVDAKDSPITGKSLQNLPITIKHLEVPFCFLQNIDINTILFKLPPTCQQITFGHGPGSVALRRDNSAFLRDTLKHRYFTPQTIQWVFDEILRPVASILGLVLVTHLLFTNKQYALIPFAIAFVPTIASSILFVLQRYLDPDTSLFSWRPSTSILIPQLIVFSCYTLLYIFFEHTRRPFSHW